MTDRFTPRTHALQEHEMVRVAPGRAVQVCSRSGTLWVTIDGSPVDIELEAGACRTFDLRSPLLASALGGAAVLTVTPLQPRSWRQRLSAAFGRASVALAAS